MSLQSTIASIVSPVATGLATSILGPAGPAVSSMLLKAVGLSPGQEESLPGVLQNMPPDVLKAKIEEVEKSYRAALRAESNMYGEEQKTIRQMVASSDKYVRRVAPTAGYSTMGLCTLQIISNIVGFFIEGVFTSIAIQAMGSASMPYILVIGSLAGVGQVGRRLEKLHDAKNIKESIK